jgi:hypothetical protein
MPLLLLEPAAPLELTDSLAICGAMDVGEGLTIDRTGVLAPIDDAVFLAC